MAKTNFQSTNKVPAVSIIMPCYNLGRYVEDALESLSKQTFQNFHLTIVDDASTDPETKKILGNLVLPKNANLITEKKNLGLSGVRNKYIRKAKSKYVFSFDPDDVLKPTFLEKSVAYLESNPKKAAVATWLEKFGIESGVVKLNKESASLPSMLISNHYLGSCVFRKKVFSEVGGYDTAQVVYGAEDYDFWLSVLERGWSLGVIEEPLFRYRRLANSSSSQSSTPEKSVQWRKYIVEKHINLYSKNLLAVVVGFEKRASESHTGYIDTSRKLTLISQDYKELHTYVEADLIPKLNRYKKIINRLRFFRPRYYINKIKTHTE